VQNALDRWRGAPQSGPGNENDPNTLLGRVAGDGEANCVEAVSGGALPRGNLLRPLPGAGAGEVFDDLPAASGVRIERIVSRGNVSPPGEWYDQDDDEWVLVLEGEGELEFANPIELVLMGVGDWIFIPAHRRHRVVRSADPTVWLAVWPGRDER